MEFFALSSKRILCIQIEGPIPFKCSIDQSIACLYFLRISSSFYSSCLVNAADIIIGLDFFSSNKAYFKCSGNSFKVNPSKLVYDSFVFSSLLHFSGLFSFTLKTVSFKSKLEFGHSQSISSRYLKFISFSLIEF